MNLKTENKQVNKYIINNVIQLPAAYVLSDYYELLNSWEGTSLTKEMEDQLNKARQKSISAGSLLKLNEIIIAYNKNESTNSKSINKQFRKSIRETIKSVSDHIDFDSQIEYKLLIEHGTSPKSTQVELVQNNSKSIYIESDIDFSSIWGILESEAWEDVEELFEGVFLGDNEFIQVFKYSFKLQSYIQFQQVLKELNIFKPNNKLLPSGMKITIGEHDCQEFEFEVK